MKPAEIKEFRIKHNLTQEQLSNIVAVKVGTVRSWEQGKRNIPDSAIVLMKNFENKDVPYIRQRQYQKSGGGESVIKFYNQTTAIAGIGTHSLLPQKTSDNVFLPKEMFKNADFVIRLSGNSMLPNYPSDAVIGIRLIEKNLIQPGSVYAVEVDNDIMVKRLYYKDDDQYSGYYVCMSDNDMIEDAGLRKGKLKYPPFELQIDKQVRRVFKVTDFYKSNEIRLLK